jgi:hypothetical protein
MTFESRLLLSASFAVAIIAILVLPVSGATAESIGALRGRLITAEMPDESLLKVQHGTQWCRLEQNGTPHEQRLLASWSGPNTGHLLAGFVDCSIHEAVIRGHQLATVTAQLRRLDVTRGQQSAVRSLSRESFLRSIREVASNGIDYAQILEDANRYSRSLNILEQTSRAMVGFWRQDETALYLAMSTQIRIDAGGTPEVHQRIGVQAFTLVAGWGFTWAVYRPYSGSAESFEKAFAETRQLIQWLVHENPSVLPKRSGIPSLPPGTTPIPQRR